MKCLSHLYVPQLHSGVLAMKAAGMKPWVGNCLFFCQPQTGTCQAAPRTNVPLQYQSYISAQNDSIKHSSIPSGIFQSGWIFSAAARRNKEREKESWNCVHLGHQPTFFLLLYQLFFQIAETCKHWVLWVHITLKGWRGKKSLPMA